MAINPVWDFEEQKNKFGYLNNPRWSSQGDAQEFCNKRLISLDRSVHTPCGHWHKDIGGEGAGYALETFYIAFEAYDSDGNQIGYIICRDGKLGDRELVLTDNVINPHPIYPFSRLYSDHDAYAPDGYEEWGDWFATEQAAFAEPNDLVYPFHFPDWKLCTGWADEDGFYRGYEDPDTYIELANPYPLAEVPYVHSIQPPDKFIFVESGDDYEINYYDVSQHTDDEEKVMTWIPEEYAVLYELEDALLAFDNFFLGYDESYESDIPIFCEFYDCRFDADWQIATYGNLGPLLPGDNGVGNIWGVKRPSHILTNDIRSALTGITVTEKDRVCKLILGGGEGSGLHTYANQYSYPYIESLRYKGDRDSYYNEDVTNIAVFITAFELGDVPDMVYEGHYQQFHDFTGHDCNDDINMCVCDYRTYWTNYNRDWTEGSEYYDVIASIAKSNTDFVVLVQQGSYNLNYDYATGEMTSTPCGQDFSPDYWPEVGPPDFSTCVEVYRGPVDESNCVGPSVIENNTIVESAFEYYLMINGVKVHTFKSDDGSHYDDVYCEGAGYGFIRHWDEPSWILVSTSIGKRYIGYPSLGSYDLETVIYQLWNDLNIELIDSVEFDYINPGDPFLDSLDRWEEGYQANWHNVTDNNGETILAPNGQPVICSGHFRCFRSIETGDRIDAEYDLSAEPQVWRMDF